MKWIKILLSAATLELIYQWVEYMNRDKSDKLDQGAVLLTLIWMSAGVIGLFIIIARIFGFIRRGSSFPYIFLGTTDLLLSMIGLYIFIPAESAYLLGKPLTITLLLISFFMGAYILWDALTYKAAKSTSD